MEELLNQIVYEIWPPRPTSGQQAGPGPQGVKGTHPLGIEACCMTERSQHKNKQKVKDMIEWALAEYVK